jgi:hypothetical protein
MGHDILDKLELKSDEFEAMIKSKNIDRKQRKPS